MEIFLLGVALGAGLVYASQQMGPLSGRRSEQEVVRELLEELARRSQEIVDEFEQQKREFEELMEEARGEVRRAQTRGGTRPFPGEGREERGPETTVMSQGVGADFSAMQLDVASSPEPAGLEAETRGKPAPSSRPVSEGEKSFPAEPMLEKSSQNQEVLKRAAQGASPDEIARQLGMGVGEVQLVLNLFQRH